MCFKTLKRCNLRAGCAFFPIGFNEVYYPLLFIILFFSVNSYAVLEIDHSAPIEYIPQLTATEHGTPQLNIVTPNGQGVSHNKLQRLDLDERGLILGNSAIETLTLAEERAAANPNLVNGAAQLIITEVNSPDLIHLNGKIEVAGPAAQVVVFASSGIVCNECGAINSQNFVLTTARPQIYQGEITNYEIKEGVIAVEYQGLDNSDVDYSAIIAKNVSVNGEISAKELKIVTGAPQTDVKKEEQDSEMPAIDLAISSKLLAKNIHLVSHENGGNIYLGGSIGNDTELVKITTNGQINNEGSITAEQLTMTNGGGNIVNSGSLHSSNMSSLNTQQDFINHEGGIIESGGEVVLKVAKHIVNEGKVSSQSDLNVVAESVHNKAGLFMTQKRLDILTQSTLNNEGRIMSDDDLIIQTDGLTNGKSEQDTSETGAILAKTMLIKAQTLSNDANSIINAQTTLKLVSFDITNQNHSVLNSEGEMELDITGTLINRDQAIIKSGADLTLHSSVNESGWPQSVQNESAIIETNGDLSLSAAQVNNIDRYFDIKPYVVSKSYVYDYRVSDDDVHYLPEEVTFTEDGTLVISSSGRQYRNYFSYQYEQTVSEGRISLESQPATIFAKGHLTIHSDKVFNLNSRIIGEKGMTIPMDKVDDQDYEGVRRVFLKGKAINFQVMEQPIDGSWLSLEVLPYEELLEEQQFDLHMHTIADN